ncbi:hypothetical protein [Salinibaculum rarum]|uniref:hypothetical protein n=1 Tax=Salinibaculum rarum TaxID=3058903 RepID=UPI00265F46E0|nr:hypothetical protein [Salinibaculum sp. KK48]
MTRKLCALVLATLLLCATPLAGAAVAADAGNTPDDPVGNESDSFGMQVSLFVDSAKENETGPLGPLVASFVVSNNPGNAPDHAGPPAWVVGGDENETDDNETRGPPEDVGPNGTQGPPADAGPSDDNETRGPPADAGPNDEREDSDGDEEDESDGDEESDERRGPPAHAGPR